MSRRVTAAWAAGDVTDSEGEELYNQIEKQRRSIFQPRLPRRRVKRTAEELAKRHRLAYSGPMPGHLAAAFTRSELAVMAIIAYDGQGTCTLTVAKLADRALVGRSTVQKAIRLAERMGLITVEERKVRGDRNLPNLIRIVSPEWRTWLERGGSKKLKPIDTRFNIPCNSVGSNPSIPVWKRSTFHFLRGLHAIPNPQQKSDLAVGMSSPQSPRVLIR